MKILISVCETKFRKYNLEDQSANCTIVSENVCFNEVVNGVDQEVCRDVPKTECEVVSQDLSKSFPETEVPEFFCKKSEP